MLHFPHTLDQAASDAAAARIRARLSERGFGLWAVEVPGVTAFAGFAGLSEPAFRAHFTPCVEIGWRLAFEHWGKGYATEAARAALIHAFGPLGLEEVVSFTVPGNSRSRRVMKRLGMRRNPGEDFDHPDLPARHPLRPHVLYRLSRADWISSPPARSIEQPPDRSGERCTTHAFCLHKQRRGWWPSGHHDDEGPVPEGQRQRRLV
jgi:RimJ/RimL family protein N-acetyltransferase